jgi:hypothetical protein
MTETSEAGVVLTISALLLWICFGLRISDFGFMPAQDGGTAKIRPFFPVAFVFAFLMRLVPCKIW